MDSVSVTEYLDDLMGTLQRSLDLAGDNLKEAQHKQKTWYDYKARERLFNP